MMAISTEWVPEIAQKASAQLPARITRHLVSDRFSLISEKRSRKSAARSLPFILGRAHHVIPLAVRDENEHDLNKVGFIPDDES